MVESTNKSVKKNNKKTEYKKLTELKDMTDAQDKSIGCILGAFIGDSLGSYLEFNKGIQSAS